MLLDPIKSLTNSSTARAMLIISLVTAMAAIGDKIAISHSSPLAYLALNMTGAFLVLAMCDAIVNTKHVNHARHMVKLKPATNMVWLLLIMGSLYLLTQLLSFVAIDLAPNTSYAVAVRNLNIVVASLAAIFLFHEELTRYKLLSYGLSAGGVILIAL